MAATPEPAPVSAARFVLSVGGTDVVFSGLTGISSDIDPAGDAAAGSPPADRKSFGTVLPPTVTLKRGLEPAGDDTLWTWHQAARAGDPTARRTCQLVLQDAGGQALVTYVLENAWPSSLEIAGPAAGAPPAVTESVELTCDSVSMQPGSPAS
jgi:phage tail-like protein